MATTASTDSPDSTSWRRTSNGGAAENGAAHPRRWQAEPHKSEPNQLARKRKRFGTRTIVLLAFTTSTLLLLLYLLLYDPHKTPTITLTATNYQWPLPPNSWAAEDTQRLESLDGSTLQLYDLSEAAASKDKTLDSIATALKSIGSGPLRQRSVVIYLSMYGLVDQRGVACLAPENADPLNRTSWLPVKDLLHTINAALPTGTNKLLILDATRFPSAWQLGVIGNTFPERLADEVESLGLPNLAVLSSAGPGQFNEGAPQLKASPFGHFTQLALAGAADRSETFGNANGSVQLHELHHYLLEQVNRWSLAGRGRELQPQLLPSTAADFHVTWSLRENALEQLTAANATLIKAQPSVSAEQIGSLWDRVQRLEAHAPNQYAPLTWARLKNRIVWLEQAAVAGSAYEQQAPRVLQELASSLETMLQRAHEKGTAHSLPQAAAVFAVAKTEETKAFQPHSLALGEYFGVIDSLAVSRATDTLQNFVNDPDLAQLKTEIATAAGRAAALQFEDFYFLHTAAECQMLTKLRDQGTLAQIMELRQLAEQVAVPTDSNRAGDPRTHQAVRQLVTQGDQSRRAVEDGALLGAELNELGGDLAAAREAYTSAQALMAELTRANALRDQILAEAPYLAKWLSESTTSTTFRYAEASPGLGNMVAATEQPKSADELVDFLLMPLIESTQRLSALLNKAAVDEGHSPTQALALKEAIATAEKQFTQLQTVFTTHCLDLTDSPQRDALALHRITNALTVPDMTWETRQLLRKQQAVISRKLTEEYAAAQAKPTDSQDTANTEMIAAKPAVVVPSVASWQRHPLWAWFEANPATATAPEAGATDSDIVDDLNGFVRESLLQLSLEVNAPAPESLEPNDSLAERTRFSRAALQLRSAASLYPGESLAHDSTGELRRYDLQQLLLWHADRTIENFWGPLPDEGLTDKPRLLFQLAAEDYLAAARATKAPSQSVTSHIKQIHDSLLTRVEAASHGLGVQTNSTSLFDLSEQHKAEVTITPQVAAAAFPIGRAAVMLENNGRLVHPPRVDQADHSLADVALPPLDKQPVEMTVQLPETIIDDPTLTAVVSFRGHRFSSPLFLEGMEGVVIGQQPQAGGPPQLTLFGQRKQRSSIVFILDCSASMNDEIQVEAAGVEQRPRLDLAKSALQGMLTDLALRGESRVGVRFFGHRVGWSSDAPLRLLANNNYSRPIPEGLAPSADVEAVQTLGRFDTIEAGKVIRLMDTVEGHGQSPLNLALIEALQDFSKDDRETDKSIIVITDGVNFQFTPPGTDRRTSSPTTVDAVIEAWQKQSSVPIHILGFGVAADEAEQAQRDFSRLERVTGGSYHSVSSGLDLLRLLNEQLALGGYYVENSQGQVVTGTSDGAPRLVQLNTPVSPSDWQGQAADYVLHFQDLAKPFRFYGGETLQMELIAGGSDIGALPYEPNFPVERELVQGEQGKGTGYLLRCHQPLWQGERVSFPISWQDQHSHFTRRVAEVWAEITPIDSDNNDLEPSYLFYDLNYQPNKPVPVIELTAQQWPTTARRARVQLWCKPLITQPAQVISLAEVAANAQRYNDGIELAAVPDVNLRIQQRSAANGGDFVVSVIEQHGESSPGIYSLKVELTGSKSPPSEVLHHFDQKHRTVVHTFRFPAAAEKELSSEATAAIRLTTGEALHDGAWHLPRNRAVVVNIQKQADVFSPEAADLPLRLLPPEN